jgi:ferredoxin
MQYGFLIDHRRCIGCHACTVACKAENDVPVGDFRTWVKYQEKGVFPAIKRHFAVLRCNHCTSAPCVTICPVNALEKRKDGIVDLDRDACIGCRAYDRPHHHREDRVSNWNLSVLEEKDAKQNGCESSRPEPTDKQLGRRSHPRANERNGNGNHPNHRQRQKCVTDRSPREIGDCIFDHDQSE